MNRGQITVRYAKSLFELGKEKNLLDKFYSDSKLLLDHCYQVKDFCVFLNNPVIKPSQKKEVIRKVLGPEQHPFMIKFINLVIDKDRENLLSDMIRYFEDLYKKYKGIKTVTLITAVPLEKEYLNNLQIFLEREFSAPIEMEAQIKPDILGGLILIVDDKILDNSILHQMKLLRNKILS